MAIEDQRVITTLKYSRYRVKPTVVNGEPVNNLRVPYIVSIKNWSHRINRTKVLWSNLCGGSIIGENKVLTAAHCFDNNNYYFARHAELLRVTAGNNHTDLVHSGDVETTRDGQWRKIDKIIIHRDYDFPTNDISLVFVDSNWNYTQFVDYIIPAVSNTDYPRSCFSAGYGKTSHRLPDISPKLLMAQIFVIDRQRCSKLWEMNMNTFVCSDSVVTDVAVGDSGGPLACYGTLDPAETPGKEILVGIVSGKNYDRTTLYTRVSAYHDWILKDRVDKIAPSVQMTIILLLLIYLLFLFNCVISVLWKRGKN